MDAIETDTYRMGDSPESAARRFAMFSFLLLPALGVAAAVVLGIAHGVPLWCWVLLFWSWLWTGLGGTVGYHRMLSHRSFQAPAAVRAFWIAAASIGGQGSPLVWAGLHRIHHANSDKQRDLHSPWNEGRTGSLRDLFHAHCGWLINLRWNGQELDRMVPDLRQDPVICYFERTHAVWPFIGLLAPALFGLLVTRTADGALLGLLWGGLVRLFLTQHLSWGVNSACHRFGKVRYLTNDLSKNNWFFGLFALGEGWHNNHHAFPASARHGFGLQFDTSWCVIRLFSLMRLVSDVHLPDPQTLEKKRLDRPRAGESSRSV